MFKCVVVILQLVLLGSCMYLDPLNQERFEGIRHVLQAKGMIFICKGGQGIAMLGLGNLRMPVPVVTGTLDTVSCSMSAADSEYLYVADTYEMAVYDIADITAPLKVGSLQLKKGNADFVLVSGTYAYIFATHTTSSGAEYSLHAASVANPEDPVLVGTLPLRSRIIDAVSDDKYIIAVSAAGYIIAFDAKKAYDFAILTITPLPATPTCIAMFREFIYVGVGEELRTYNIESIKQLEEAVKWDIGSTIRDIVFTRGNVYVAADAGLVIIDVKDPRHPFESGYRSIPSPARSMEVFVDIAYIVTVDGQLLTIDVLPPEEEVSIPAVPETRFKKHYDIDSPADRANETIIDTYPVVPLQPHDMDEGIIAWRDLSESTYFDVPEWMLGATTYVGTQTFRVGLHFRFSCAHPVCNGFVFLEHCLPCSVNTNGGLPSILTTDGWVPSSCGPRFRLGPNAAPHQTVLFRKQFRQGEISVLPALTKDARFIGLSIKEGKNICSDINDEAECTSKTILCAWDEIVDGCMPKITRCPRMDTVSPVWLKTEGMNCTKCAGAELSVKALKHVI